MPYSFDNIMMFSKHLQDMEFEEMCLSLNKIGVNKLDLTVRPGGHVDPEKVESELPVIKENLQKHGIGIGMVSTNITDPTDSTTLKILRTIAEQEIKYYKIGYYMYEGFNTLKKQREDVRGKLEGLSDINGELGLHGGYHNHSDMFFGASLWDTAEVIKNCPKETIGIYLDPGHATIEGGSAGWMMAMDLVSDRITMLAVKDFRWLDDKSKYAGGRRHSIEFLPLSEGNTPWDKVLEILKQIGFNGPISFHSEYQGEYSYRDLNCSEVLEATVQDMEYFKSLI